MSKASISVVIPIYNEVDNIQSLHEALVRVLRGLGRAYEIILVDDGSTDGSTERLSALAASDPHVRIVEFRRNFGQTAAIRAGLALASCEVIITLDGDLQNDPADIPLLLAKIDEGYDLVHGWRRDRQDAFFSRKLPSRVANWLIARVTRFPVHDLGCTLKAIRREHAQELPLYGELHRFIPILAHWQGARCAEVITRHRARTAGRSKYGLSRTLRVLLDLATVKYLIDYSASPMRLFGMVGLACLAGSFASALAAITLKLLGPLTSLWGATGNSFGWASAAGGIIGAQFLMLGLLAEVSTRIYHESQQKPTYRVRRMVNFDPFVLGVHDRREAA